MAKGAHNACAIELVNGHGIRASVSGTLPELTVRFGEGIERGPFETVEEALAMAHGLRWADLFPEADDGARKPGRKKAVKA